MGNALKIDRRALEAQHQTITSFCDTRTSLELLQSEAFEDQRVFTDGKVRDRILATANLEDESVSTFTACQRVIVKPACKRVITIAAIKAIIASATNE